MIRRLTVGALAALGVAGSASAQDDWDWQVAPYMWSAGIKGDVQLGNVRREVDIDFKDLADKMADVLLLHAEAHKGDNAFFGDLIFMSLAPENEIATAGGVTEANFDTTILEAGFLKGGGRTGLEFGVRYWDFSLEVDPATLPAVERSVDWADAFIGIRKERPLGTNWVWQSRLNLGTGGSDGTFGAQSTFSRKLSSGNAFIIGVKTLIISYEDENVGGLVYELDGLKFAGLTIGFNFD